jgi:hypothetical protein
VNFERKFLRANLRYHKLCLLGDDDERVKGAGNVEDPSYGALVDQ